MPRFLPSLLCAAILCGIATGIVRAQTAPRLLRSAGDPKLIVVTETQSYSFGVSVITDTPATVRWFREGRLVSEQAGQMTGPAVLSITNASTADTGTYWVEATNAGGTSQSDWFTFIVRAGERPYFAVGPTAVGAPFNFISNPIYVADPPVQFQWLRDGVAVPNGATAYLSISTIPAGSYSLRIRNAWGEVVSPGLALPILHPGAGPAIIRQPASTLTLDVGSDYALSVMTSTADVTYQWFKDGQPLAGETREWFSFQPYDPGKAGRYHVVLTNATGATTRSAESLVQTHAGHETPSAAILPGRTVARNTGESLTLYGQSFGIATAFPVPSQGSNLPAARLQWLHNGTPIAGATTQSLFIPRVGPQQAGNYVFIAEDSVRRAESPSTTVTVSGSPPARPPFVFSGSDTSSSFLTYDVGRPISLGAQVVSDLPVTYEWYRNGVRLPQQTHSQLEIPVAQLTDAGTYVLIARNSTGAIQAYAQRVEIRDDGMPRFLQLPPAKVLLLPGSSFTPALRFTGNPNVTWKKDGQTIYHSVRNPGGFSIAYDEKSPGTYTAALETFTSFGTHTTTSTSMVVTLGPADFAGIYAGTRDPFFGRRSWLTNIGTLGYVRPDGSAVALSIGGGVDPSYVLEDIRLNARGEARFTVPANANGASTPFILTARGGVLSIDTAAEPSVRYVRTSRALSGDLSERAGLYRGQVNGDDGGPVHAIVTADGYVGLRAVSAGSPYGAYGRLQIGQRGTVRQDGFLPSVPELTLGLDVAATTISGTILRADGSTRTFSAARTEGLSRSRLSNLASRGVVGSSEQTMIAGFTLAGSGRLPVLIRGIGPSLQQFGVTEAIDRSRLMIYSGDSAIAQNDMWSSGADSSGIAATSGRLGAFPLTAGSSDAAVLRDWTAGSYTALLTHPAGHNGIGLVEIYDDGNDTASGPQLSNLSVRGHVGAGQAALIAGISIGGAAPRRLLFRGIGPSLKKFGLNGILADPFLRLFSGESVVAENDNWPPSSELIEMSEKVGAFALTDRSRDAAFILTLPPGSYSAVLVGNDDDTGIGLLEVYELP